MKFSRRSLLLGTTALTFNAALTGAIVFMPEPVLASCQVVSGSDATISSSISCITWDSNSIVVNSSGTVTGSVTGVFNNGNAVGNLTNSGSIGGGSYGIYNSETIGTITNNINSTISGSYDAIRNGGSIGTINNSGIISSNSAYAIFSPSAAHISTITNSGTISGALGLGLNNTVGGINNSGDIIGLVSTGIESFACNIGAITNSGTISGDTWGIHNLSSSDIGTITNSGLIAGDNTAIYNDADVIGTIINSIGGTVSGHTNGIQNTGTIVAITNSGTISGGTNGINNSGLIGGGATAIDSTGTIVGAISNSGTINGNIIVNQGLTITGGTGTLTGGTITTNNHDLLFDSGAHQVLNDDVNVGSSNTFSLNGVAQVNVAHSITGNYTQGSSASLIIGVASSMSYGDLIVSGNATMTDDHVTIASIGGTLTDGESFTIAQDAISGTPDYAGIAVTVPHGFTDSVSSITSGGFDDLVVTLTACGQTVSGGSATISGGACGMIWTGGNISITGSGHITGSTTAIVNSDNSVGTLTNDGVIDGSSYGINNSGTIVAIVNDSAGTINGGSTGIYNNGGTINIITNSIGGTISGNSTGIYNSGSIGTISNSGLISSNNDGITNNGTIDSIVNIGGGTILAIGNGDVVNEGTIGTLINSGILNDSNASAIDNNSGSIGTIVNNSGGTLTSHNYAGIYNSGIIGSINNGGLINNIGGGNAGIENTDSIGAITNSGTISGGSIGINNQGLIGSGATAIDSTGTIIGALSNSGTISGNIIVNQGLTITGGTGTLTGGTITTGNHDLLFDSSANQVLDDDINVGASNTFSLNGVAQVNVAHSITGSYTQNSSASLIIGVASSISYGDLIVSGNATMTDDHVTITPISGSLTAGETFTIVQDNTISGTADYTGVTAKVGQGFTGAVSSITSSGFDDLVITLAACGQTVSGGNATISGSPCGVTWTGGNVSITGSGRISGSTTAIVNSGNSVGTLTNDGIISGTQYGVNNSGIITAIINDGGGTISGGAVGIDNNGGTIVAIVNNNGGAISSHTGVFNDGKSSGGSISTISNSGVISSSFYGIRNYYGSIATIDNNSGGVINGSAYGISNELGSIATISNNGTITENSVGIRNFDGTIGNINNSGTISSGSTGINNGGGSIGSIANSGTISGRIGIYNSGLIGGGATAIVSNSGTIIGAIANSGTISGNIIVDQDLTITPADGNGTLTGGTITTGNHDLLFAGSGGTQLLDDNINVGASNTVSVAGTIQVNTLHSISGNYAQTSGGLLVIGVTNSSTYGDLSISGAATLTDDHVSIANLGSGLSDGETFTILQASSIGTDYTGVVGLVNGFLATPSSIIGSGIDSLIVTLSACSNVPANNTTISSGVCGVTWNGGNLSITGSAVIAGSATAVLNSGNSVGTLTNDGNIIGSTYGINNTGTIAAIINDSGLISSNNIGILNDGGTIGTITNSIGGTINGYNGTGINNDGGSIGVITNSGLISGNEGINNPSDSSIGSITNSIGGTIGGDNGTGINNDGGSIGAITNSGLIGGNDGIVNGGSIDSITNSIGGTISGSNSTGIGNNNGGIIGTITNSGLISGNYNGISNYNGTIGTITNSIGGTIRSTITGCSTCAAITNYGGTIGTITNSGLISGPQAIYSGNSGTVVGTILSAITNTGTIAGNINVNQDLTFTGGNASTIGTLTGFGTVAGTITATDLTFDSAAYQLLDDDVNVGSGLVTNSGTLMLNATHTITGNYTQGSSALLVIGVIDPTHYGQVVITGNATMTNDQVSITPVSGSLTNGESFTIVKDSTIGTADYSGITATATGFTTSVTSSIIGSYDDLIVDLTSGGGGGGGGGGGPYGSIGNAAGGGVAGPVGAALDEIQTSGNPAFDALFTALNNLGSISQAAEQQGIKELAPNQVGPQIATSGVLAGQTMLVVGQHQDGLLAQNSQDGSNIGKAAGSEYESGIFWAQVSGGVATQDSTAASSGYQQSFYGMTFGIDNPIDKNTSLGEAISWMHSDAGGNGDLTGSDVSVNSFQLTGYGSHRFGAAFVDGMLGIGINLYKQSRDIAFLAQQASASYDGMQYMGRIETGYDFTVPVAMSAPLKIGQNAIDDKNGDPNGFSQTLTLTPLLGLQAVRTDTNSYSESGAGVADNSVSGQGVNSFATTLGGRIATTLPTAWGDFTPEFKAVWVHDLTNGAINTPANLGGVSFTTATPRIAPDGAQLTLAATLKEGDDVSVRAEYDGDLRSGYTSSSGLVKLEWKF